MATASSRTNLKSPTNIPLKKMSSTSNSLKLNGNLIGLPKQAVQIHQPPQHPHQQHHLPQQPQLSPAFTSLTGTSQQQQSPQIAHSASATVLPQVSSSLHHFHAAGNPPSGTVLSSSHSTHIPPRYQPPPQPSGGILKHLPNQNSKPCAGYYPPDGSVPPHLNIKYPPDIPKLASVYIPESLKAGPAQPSRFAQRPPPHRFSAGHVSVHHEADHHGRGGTQVQQQQQQDMLKFVRKPDPDPGSSAGAVSGTGTMAGMLPGRLSAEQNRHLQVSRLPEIQI